MTRWIEDPTLDAPDDHRWMKPAPEDCPNCPCHTARVCAGRLWRSATPATYPDGSVYREPCPCRTNATAQAVVRDAMREAFPGPAPECCGHVTCKGDGPCGYIVVAMIDGSARCECTGS